MFVVAIETAVVICEEGKKWLNEIGKQRIDKTGDIKARCYLMQRITNAIQKPNNACIISARLSDKKLDSIFYW